MPIPTPFFSRTFPLVESHEWRNWSGYLAAGVYEPSHEREYYAIRNSVAVIDVSPLYKYEIAGPDAFRLVDRIFPRDLSRCVPGHVLYSPWCDEDGKVIDDGTITCLDDGRFRITAADPSLYWFREVSYGFRAEVTDLSEELAALAVQGPNSRAVLKSIVADVDLDRLGYFRMAEGQFNGSPVTVTRTGYTGDLGYELWLRPQDAERLWDMLMDTGRDYGVLPVGMVALDLARIEAGFLLVEVDYISAHHARTDEQKSSPYELGLGWTVDLNGDDFVGRHALVAEKAAGPAWRFIGLSVDWPELERLFDRADLPPQVAGRASRSSVPLYQDDLQIGQATSHAFSPILKEYIAIGTVSTRTTDFDRTVQMEVTVEHHRRQAQATIVKPPFFNPPQKRS
jgi:aminomethyltransferase